MMDSPLVDIGRFLTTRQYCSVKEKEPLASGSRDDGNKGDQHLRCDGAFSGAVRAHMFEEGVLHEFGAS